MPVRKTCPACGKSLSDGAFNASSRSPDGLARTCRACTNARRRELATDRRPASHARSTIVAKALRDGDLQTMRKLLRAGLKPHWSWICELTRSPPICKGGPGMVAPQSSGHPFADLLFASGVEHNVFTMAALADANGLARWLRRVPAEARLAVQMEPAGDRVTPLHVGCASDWSTAGENRMSAQVQAAGILIDHGADLEAVARYRGISDATPLFCACWNSENLPLVRWLLDRGAIATDGHFLAALGHLQRHGRKTYDIANALLDWGLPVDGTIAGHRTPLQAFAHQGSNRTAAWLIAHGADVNARRLGGRTAAHFAAERNTGSKTLALLVEHGADLSLRDDDGHTPLEIAKLNRKARLVEWMARRARGKRR